MSPAQRKAAAGAFGLLVLAVAIILIVVGHSDVVDVISMVFGGLGALVAGWQVWLSGQGTTAVEPLADQLARRVRGQCALDALANDLNEHQLRVQWKKVLPGRTDRADGEIAAELLTGHWFEVDAQYRRIPTGRWVVLGEGGAGKSSLMTHLMRLLLRDRANGSGDRVPLLVPLSAWNPEQPVRKFLAQYLSEQFPGLRLPAGLAQDDRQRAIEELVEEQLLPIFDGLDELDPGLRVATLRELSRQDRGFPFILTSRPDAFHAAVEGRGRGVAFAPVVQLLPLQLEQIEQYLCGVPGSAAEEWAELLRGLDQSHPLAEALATPLMVWLAGASYAGRPYELASGPGVDDITDRLLDALIPARYAGNTRWPAEAAERWFTYLAREVERRRGESHPQPGEDQVDDKAGRIAWWRLADAAEPTVSRIAAVAALLTTGGAVGLGAGYLFGPWIGVIGGLALGLLVATGTLQSRLEPTTVVLQLSLRLPVGLAAGLFIGLVGGGAAWVVNRDLSAVWALAGFGVPLGIVYGLTAPVDVDHAISPASVLKRERIFVLAYVIAYGLACGIAAWALADLRFGVLLGVVAGLAGGLFNGLPWLVVHTVSGTEKVNPRAGAVAWFRFLLAKVTWLGNPPVLPWRLMTFLEDARDRGILQQVGATYQFRHRRLSERLAARASAVTTTAARSGSGASS